MKSSPSISHYVVVSVKSTVKILSIFVAFLENTNFNSYLFLRCTYNSYNYLFILIDQH